MSKTSPLHEEHVRAGAKLTDFAGWDMPLVYPEGTIVEHKTVRSSAGLFDVTHLGKLTLTGEGAEETLDRLLPGKVAKLRTGKAGYNVVLTPEGGVVDDLFVYKREGPDNFMVVPNAANTDAVLEFLRSNSGPGIEITDARQRWAILALSGPKVREIVAALLPDAENMKMHDFVERPVQGMQTIVARTGYTGEVTYEFFVEWDEAVEFWNLLLKAGKPYGIKPAGLGARDTLRLEMGYALHGHELSVDINPLEGGVGWLIDWDKEFLLKDVLVRIKQEGLKRKLVGLVAEPGRVPRAGHQVFLGEVPVGEVTSGNFSPVLGTGIALALVSVDHSAPGTSLQIDVRGRKLPVEVTKPPFKKS
ncbi:MAG: glycine cleavage system aminomethyltransferase GcvT [Actinomycetota bacterium]